MLGASIQLGSTTGAVDYRQQLQTLSATPSSSHNQEKQSDFVLLTRTFNLELGFLVSNSYFELSNSCF